VQQECIPQAALGMDIICQAKSGMGKTAVFVLAVLQQLPKEIPEGQVDTLVLCHTRELAYQICQEFLRFSKYLPEVKVKVFFGGIAIEQHRKLLQTEVPNIVVGTPGRVLALINEKKLKLDGLKRFVLDECDQMLEKLDMRRDVQQIFKQTPHEKQVMMFSATLSKEIRPVCRKFTQHVRTHNRTFFSLLPSATTRLIAPNLLGDEFQAWLDSLSSSTSVGRDCAPPYPRRSGSPHFFLFVFLFFFL